MTGVRFHAPRSTGKLIGMPRKVTVPNSQNAARVGDAELDVEVTLPTEAPASVVLLSLFTATGESNTCSILVVSDTPRLAEKEPNDGFRNAQGLTLPAIVEGSIRQNQDVGVYRFEGKSGESIRIESQAACYGSPVDGFPTVYDSDGRGLRSAGESKASLDAPLEVKIPLRDGTYSVVVMDSLAQVGATFLNRLLLRNGR